jgi:NAD(P)H-hydrate repair Nnr-like enzyme with NAD(P)H-hydrate dehydratase domain
MSRIKVLDEALWPHVSRDVIEEAEHAAQAYPCWIVQQGNGHIVTSEGPGSPDVATGDIIFIAEVAPSQGPG